MIVTFFKRYAASIALLLVAGSIALLVLFISTLSDHTDANSSLGHSAKGQATKALGQERQLLIRLQSEADGECFRVNYLRWNIDRVVATGYRRDVEAAKFLRHDHIHRLAHVFDNAAQSAAFLPLTDCTIATNHPVTYRPANAIPLSRVPKTQLRAALKSPPVPPKP